MERRGRNQSESRPDQSIERPRRQCDPAEVETAMRAILWQGSCDAAQIVRIMLQGVCEAAGISFEVVDTQAALLAAAARVRRATDLDLLIIDCFAGEPADIDRCIAVATQTQLRLYIVHPRASAVRQVADVAGREVVWIPAEGSMRDSLDLLHTLRALAAQEAHRQRPLLTRREQEVAALLAEGYTNTQIAAQLLISEETAHTHVQSILRKFGVPSRRAFGRVYHPQRGRTGGSGEAVRPEDMAADGG